MKSNLCQGINIYGAINAYEPNSTMIKFNSAYIVTARSGSPQIMPCMSLVIHACCMRAERHATVGGVSPGFEARVLSASMRNLYSVEWNGGMERWNGIVEWNGGIVE